jgi:hypothetical protein
MSEDCLGIGFGGHQVVVCCDGPEVRAGLESSFREMLEPGRAQALARFYVRRVGRNCYRLDRSDASGGCGSLSDVLDWLGAEVSGQLIGARPDLCWFHAGAAADGEGALLVAGPSGSGKSTIVTALARRGWQYLSDDVVALDPTSGKVFPFPRSPTVREQLGAMLPPDRLRELRKGDVSLPRLAVCKEPVSVAAVVFPAYDLTSARGLSPCPPGAAVLKLLVNSLDFAARAERAVRYACELARNVPALHLCFQNGPEAADLIITASRRTYRL